MVSEAFATATAGNVKKVLILVVVEDGLGDVGKVTEAALQTLS